MAKITISIELDSNESLQDALRGSGLLVETAVITEEVPVLSEKPKRVKKQSTEAPAPEAPAPDAPAPTPEATPEATP